MTLSEVRKFKNQLCWNLYVIAVPLRITKIIFIFTDNILLRQQPSLSLMMCFIGYSLCYISRLPICQSIENNVNIQFMLNHYNHVVGSHLNEHVINSFSYCLFFVWTSGFLIKSTYAIHSRILFCCYKIHLLIVWRKN